MVTFQLRRDNGGVTLSLVPTTLEQGKHDQDYAHVVIFSFLRKYDSYAGYSQYEPKVSLCTRNQSNNGIMILRGALHIITPPRRVIIA